MDTNKMLIHCGPQVAPLPLLSSGGLTVPTPLSWVSIGVLLGYWRPPPSLQRGRSPPIGLSLFEPMRAIHCVIWIYANTARVSRQRKLPSSVFSPSSCLSSLTRSFPFCLSHLQWWECCGNSQPKAWSALSHRIFYSSDSCPLISIIRHTVYNGK